MLIAFLIRDEQDWHDWREQVTQTPGKPIIHVADHAPASMIAGHGSERSNAVDEVEILEDEDEDDVEIVTISGSEGG